MYAFAAGRSPAEVARAAIVPLLFAVAALGQGGCAADNGAQYATAPAVAAYSQQVAAAVQVESDGLPSQPAPSARIRQMPDDPSEPFSRNYGGPNPASVTAKPDATAEAKMTAPQPAIPADLPPAFRRQLAQAGYVIE
ncbi:adhesin [Hyphomicrobium sp.]|jgi:hypothetical protein|uniref:adhesin n=1 Tax=Hyphomicrobium sp. TaxID=82 RepID=UPI002BE43360|nr:adhesin [Hyphomicrobium sp.]HVZ04612.1 adhesin [Hyphomicrobium sp.]